MAIEKSETSQERPRQGKGRGRGATAAGKILPAQAPALPTVYVSSDQAGWAVAGHLVTLLKGEGLRVHLQRDYDPAELTGYDRQILDLKPLVVSIQCGSGLYFLACSEDHETLRLHGANSPHRTGVDSSMAAVLDWTLRVARSGLTRHVALAVGHLGLGLVMLDDLKGG